MNRRLSKKIWICNDVWMDILPSFDRPQLGLNLALLSFRFDVLVDKHFDGQTTELTIWKWITIREGIGPEPKLSVWNDDKIVEFPLPDRPLPNKIRFKDLWIEYIDHSVIEFLHSNKQIWDRSGTKLKLDVRSSKTEDDQQQQPIWDVFAREIWPLFATNIRHLSFDYGHHLDNLRHRTSPTLLTDLNQLNTIDSYLFPDVISDFDGPTASSSAGHALSKWLHTPTTNGQPKQLLCEEFDEEWNLDWVNSFKEEFLCATTSVSYTISFGVCVSTTPIEPFELVNERTNEKLTLMMEEGTFYWLLKRCPIIGETATLKWKNGNLYANLNNVLFNL